MTAGTQISAETQHFALVPDPEKFSYEWPPRGQNMSANRPAPPPELKNFVRSLSTLGVPVKEIRRRVQERIGVPRYHVQTLYKDFADDLLARRPRGAPHKRRARLIEKHEGWKPMQPGSPFSYIDVLAILQSDLDSRDLAALYGVSETHIWKMRRGESVLVQKILPRVLILNKRIAPADVVYRAKVTADLASKLVDQMRNMLEFAFQEIEKHKIVPQEKVETILAVPENMKLYRKNPETGEVEERVVATVAERRAAHLSGWKKARPE